MTTTNHLYLHRREPPFQYLTNDEIMSDDGRSFIDLFGITFIPSHSSA